MPHASPMLRCHGCGALFDAAEIPAFGCPARVIGDGLDHLLEPAISGTGWPIDTDPQPYVRFRTLSLSWQLATRHGMSDADYVGMVRALDRAVAQVDGYGFRITPWTWSNALGCYLKDETAQVSGSHKSRHLMGALLYLRVLEETGLLGGRELRARPLGIASCGNAAVAAAVLAKAAEWPLVVFVPEEAATADLRRLDALGAQVRSCPRRAGEAGDPSVRSFRAALAQGELIPFSVQGPELAVGVEGGRTLAWEIAAQGPLPDVLYVQAGGGALLSSVWQGLRDARALGAIPRIPRLVGVQVAGCAPLARAWARWRESGVGLEAAARDRGRFMWPWEEVPHSAATGILDDETYDWWSACEGMAATGGEVAVVPEARILEACRKIRAATGRPVSATGAAGLAGWLAGPPDPEEVAGVLVTGTVR